MDELDVHIKVGVIGPLWIKEFFQRCFDLFPSMTPIFRLSDQLSDASVFTKELRGQVDCLLYSGRAPYLTARMEIPVQLPSFYVPLKGSGLYRALYLLNKKQSLSHISFDGIQVPYIEITKQSLQESFTYTHFNELVHADNVDEVVEHHLSVFENNPNSAVITSLMLISEKLSQLGITNEWLKPTEEDIIVILERLLLSTTQRKEKETQIVFGRIYVDQSTLMKDFATEKQLQKRIHDIYKTLLNFAEQFDAYLTALNDAEYIFVTNRGTFERITEGYKSLPLLNEMKKSLNMNLSIGIGFGSTAIESGKNARFALYQAQDYGGQCGFIVREDRKVFGPIDLISPITYPLSVTDAKLLDLAEKSGINAVHLEKALAMIKRNRLNEFTAQDVANMLGITIRSAHRILQAWLDIHIVEVAGTEKLTTRGRPRQVFSIITNEE
ncbi:hypothetical protein AN957_24500 [Cytobacillus solani]|uniref:Transcriptional regulator n=1 Tax=Cytobacillus solani TaxID=1637975 RepID=A0A0Q3QUV3_9BACI|nr:hypothetical protein AMS60_21915 [Bacillus sp. FJAT-21945]KQL21400.1 hypothetical protein AN957_24500 [Cytobacillus solani]